MTACVHVRHHRSTMITVLYADKTPPQPAADDNIQISGYATLVTRMQIIILIF